MVLAGERAIRIGMGRVVGKVREWEKGYGIKDIYV